VASKTKSETPAAPVLLNKEKMLGVLGDSVCYTTIFKWMRTGDFPLPIEIGPPGGRSSSVAWLESEVLEWLQARPRRQYGTGAHEYRGRPKDERKAQRKQVGTLPRS
jgi:predicted DNA-binding transcriptional regulator AlpA